MRVSSCQPAEGAIRFPACTLPALPAEDGEGKQQTQECLAPNTSVQPVPLWVTGAG